MARTLGQQSQNPSTAGMEYDQSSGNGFSSLTASFNSTTVNGAAFLLKNGFPGPVSLFLGVASGQTAFLGAAVYTIPLSEKDSSSQQYTLTLSREIPGQTVDIDGGRGPPVTAGTGCVVIVDSLKRGSPSVLREVVVVETEPGSLVGHPKA